MRLAAASPKIHRRTLPVPGGGSTVVPGRGGWGVRLCPADAVQDGAEPYPAGQPWRQAIRGTRHWRSLLGGLIVAWPARRTCKGPPELPWARGSRWAGRAWPKQRRGGPRPPAPEAVLPRLQLPEQGPVCGSVLVQQVVALTEAGQNETTGHGQRHDPL
jgi:hypothetical protein